MFTYLMLGTNDLARSAAFYDPVLAALGHARCITEDDD
ncbi:MAG: lactoylglutathione lyase, partial [Thiomonas sp. 20-64-9]